MDEYLDAVEFELSCGRPMGQLPETVKRTEIVPDNNRKPVTFYVGGGTPTSLSAAQLDRLLCMAEEYYDLSGCVERTVEAGRPDSITTEKLEVLKKHNITRISVNPQTMNQKTLDLIGRHHTVEDTKKAFKMAREAGFDNINMDIILGLPGEEAEDVQNTLRQIEELNPDSLTVHSLAVKRASRLTKTLREEHAAGKIADYSRYEGLTFVNSGEIIENAYKSALRMGMEPYYLYRQKNMKGGLENTGFARPGKECLYNILIMEEMQEIRWSIGCEYTYNDRFMLRAGYHHESENKGNRKYFTVGAGFHMSVFTIDAAYCFSTAQTNPLDQTMRFSLGFDLDGMRDLFGKMRRR